MLPKFGCTLCVIIHDTSLLFLSGQLATSLVREFLQFFNLEFSLSVFEPEVGIVSKIHRTYSKNLLFFTYYTWYDVFLYH